MKTLTSLVENLKNIRVYNFVNHQITSIHYDSRKVVVGTCFVAIKGVANDGHNYIAKAVEMGANTIICEEFDESEIIANITYILVGNSRMALAEISHCFYEYPSKSFINIAITGTNGKTTLTFLIKQLLEANGIKCGIIGTTGIYVGDHKIEATHTTPESLELCQLMSIIKDYGAEAVIMETSSHALHQFRVHGINFKAALFTNLTHDHLDYHKTMDEYASAKKILFDSLDTDSIAILNGDDSYSQFMIESTKSGNVKFVGRNHENDYVISNERLNLDFTSYNLKYRSIENNFKTPLLGRFNIDNSAMAIALAIELGCELNKICDQILSLAGAPGRMEKTLLSNGAFGIIDYAHTPDALEKAILSCRDAIESSQTPDSKLICLFGCGGDRDKTKRPKMGKIATKLADLTIITSDNPRTEDATLIIEDILDGVDKANCNFLVELDRAEAIRIAYQKSIKHDIILIAGKGHENYQIIGTTKHHFDDKENLSKFI